MVFENWVKDIQAAAYNGARTVLNSDLYPLEFTQSVLRKFVIELLNINE